MSEQRFEAEVLHTCVINELDENGEIINVLLVDELIKKVNDQQTIIQSLQDLCGKSDYENAGLRQKNKELQNKIDYLCETFDYGSDESIKVVRQKGEK